MDDERLREALRALPRERASDGFTRRVLARTEPRRWPAPARAWRPAAAMAIFATLALFALHGFEERRERAEHRARLQALQTERQALERELSELQRLADEAHPVVFLTSDDAERIDVVLDLARVAERASVQPAAFHPQPRGNNR